MDFSASTAPKICDFKNTNMKDYKEYIELVLHPRSRKLNKLGLLENDNLNYEFCDEFYKLFTFEQIKCLCKENGYIRDVRVLSSGKVGTASIVKIGNDTAIKKVIAVPNMMETLSVVPIRTENFKSNYNAFKAGPNEYYLLTIPSGNFENQTCLHLILNEILKDNENYLYQYDAFFCESIGGVNITEFCDKGTLSDYIDEIDDEVNFKFNDIFRQILNVLALLKSEKYMFTHNDLKTRNVFVKSGRSWTARDSGGPKGDRGADRTGSGDRFLIADFDKSSIFFNRHRFYNVGSTGFVSGFVRESFPIGRTEGTYNLTTFLGYNETVKQGILNSPYPSPMSLDIYTFFVSLCVEENFIDYVIRAVNSEQDSLIKRSATILFGSMTEKFVEILIDIRDKYIPLPKKEAKTKYRSIGTILEICSKFDLKYDLNELYDLYKIDKPKAATAAGGAGAAIPVKLSNSRRLCRSVCNQGRCDTFKYKTLTGEYNYDNCS